MKVLLKIFKESIMLSLSELRVNKLRTILSLLGIAVGIFCVISVFSVVDTMEQKLHKSVSKLGNNVIYLQKWPWNFSSPESWWKYMKRPVSNMSELKAIEEHVQSAGPATIVLYISGKTVKAGKNVVENVAISGVSHDYDKIYDLEFERGRYFSVSESASGENTALIGKNLADELFPNQDPLSQNIRVGDRSFKVLGVFKKEGEDVFGNTNDNIVMIPYNALVKMVDVKSRQFEPMIMVKAKEGMPITELKEEMRGVIRAKRKLKPLEKDNFELNQLSLLITQLNSMFGIINFAGWLIGGFAILVGGFGIANIMFVSVKERTHIIGIKKAIGAKNYFILLEFLTESVILCLLGGILGLIFVAALIFAIKTFADVEFVLTWGNILRGINISVIIGVISGFLPAYNASRLDPVVAIRYK